MARAGYSARATIAALRTAAAPMSWIGMPLIDVLLTSWPMTSETTSETTEPAKAAMTG